MKKPDKAKMESRETSARTCCGTLGLTEEEPGIVFFFCKDTRPSTTHWQLLLDQKPSQSELLISLSLSLSIARLATQRNNGEGTEVVVVAKKLGVSRSPERHC